MKAIDYAGNETLATNNGVSVMTDTDNAPVGVILSMNMEYTDDQSNKAWVPKGFKIVQDASTGNKSRVSEGLVIEDAIGNQFVWIPCTQIQLNEPAWTEWIQWCPLDSENLTAVDASLNNYGGFYFGRYEAGWSMDDSGPTSDNCNAVGIPISKKNATLWNYIDQPTAMARSSAMYDGSASVVSHLMYGAEMRRVLRWFVQTGALNWSQINQESADWGNYSGVTISGVTKYTNAGISEFYYTVPAQTKGYDWRLAAGNTEKTKVKNIYDLAGNMFEWTQETSDGRTVCHFRGGDSDAGGIPVAETPTRSRSFVVGWMCWV